MSDQIRIGVVGAGGAGGYFAHRWAEAGLDGVLIARGRHLEAIRASGLRVESPFGSSTVHVHATDDFSALGEADVVVFATKTWQLPDALAAAAPHLSKDAVLFGLQNGVESVDVLAEAHPRENVLGGTARIISFIEGPGVIRHLGVPPLISIGEPGGGVTPRVQAIADALTVEGKVGVEASDDIRRDLWRKLLFFAPVSGVGSVTRSTIGRFRTVPETRAMLHAAVREVAAVGRAEGVALGPELEEEALAVTERFPADGTTSMQRDFADGTRTELDALSGYVSRRGAALGVPTPTHDFIYAALLPLELAARERA